MRREKEVTMRSVNRRIGVLAAACLVLGAGAARAGTLEVTVPFSFMVQGQSFPAGEYRVTTEGALVAIRGERTSQPSRFFLAMPATGVAPAGDHPALTFRRYENQYRLADIWESGSYGVVPVKR
jgi:hypothetical protein